MSLLFVAFEGFCRIMAGLRSADRCERLPAMTNGTDEHLPASEPLIISEQSRRYHGLGRPRSPTGGRRPRDRSPPRGTTWSPAPPATRTPCSLSSIVCPLCFPLPRLALLSSPAHRKAIAGKVMRKARNIEAGERRRSREAAAIYSEKYSRLTPPASLRTMRRRISQTAGRRLGSSTSAYPESQALCRGRRPR